jgi:hypothetical protein
MARMIKDRQALGRTIVNANDTVVLGQQKVTFDRIGTLLPCQLKGGQGILGSIMGSSPVGNDQWV